MRSDAAPVINQGIQPTWTGAHIFSNTTASTSTMTGALTVAGGVGIAGALWVGAGANISGTADNFFYLKNSGTGNNVFTVDTASASKQTGFGLWDNGSQKWQVLKQTDQTLLIYDAVNNVVMATWHPGTASAGYLNLGNTTASTSTTTGALTVAGGLGVAGNIYAGGLVSAASYYIGGVPALYNAGGYNIFVDSGGNNSIIANGGVTYYRVDSHQFQKLDGTAIATFSIAGLALSGHVIDTPPTLNAPGNASYTLLLTDAWKEVSFALLLTAQTLTVPLNSSVAFPVGTCIFVNVTAGSAAATLTITPASGSVTIRGNTILDFAANNTRGTTLWKIATNTWLCL
jgi:hypothetical protein